MSRILDFIDRFTPKDPRTKRVLDLVLPLLVTALLGIALLQLGEVRGTANEAKETAATTQVLAHENKEFNQELTEGLISACEANGNPIRAAEREDLTEAIQELRSEITSPNDPRLDALFPNVPPATVDELIREGNEQKRERIKAKEDRRATIVHVDCANQYPGSPRGG